MDKRFIQFQRWMGFNIAVKFESIIHITPDTETTTNLYLINGQSYIIEGSFDAILLMLNECAYNERQIKYNEDKILKHNLLNDLEISCD